MTSLEQVITTMVKIFREYAQSKGDKHKLCKDELQTLLKKEIQNPKFKSKINPENINEVMKCLDKNMDNEVNFREFCRYVTILATDYYSKEFGKEGKGKDDAAQA